MEPRLATSEKLKVMLREGVPHSMRPQVYVRLCAALDKKVGGCGDVLSTFCEGGKMIL